MSLVFNCSLFPSWRNIIFSKHDGGRRKTSSENFSVTCKTCGNPLTVSAMASKRKAVCRKTVADVSVQDEGPMKNEDGTHVTGGAQGTTLTYH